MSNTTIVWEYCAMRINKDGSFKKVKFMDLDGNHTAREITDPHHELAKLGQEGWELVTFTQITDPLANIYYLKREKN